MWVIGVKEKLFCWLKLILGLDKGADDLKKELVKWQLGLDHGADLYEGNLVDILTMCKEEEKVIWPAIHPSSVLQRDYTRIFLTFLIISDWCLSALTTNCDWYKQLVRRQEDLLIVYRLLTLVQWKNTWYYQVSTNYLPGDRVLGTAKSQQTLQIK